MYRSRVCFSTHLPDEYVRFSILDNRCCGSTVCDAVIVLTNPAILEELRVRVLNGASAVEAMRFLIDRLQLGPESRLIVILYFRAAFGMEIRDASKLGAWEFFTGGTWSDKVVDDEVGPILSQRNQNE